MLGAAIGVLGAMLCAIGPAWGARGHHRAALALIGIGAALAAGAAFALLMPLFHP